MALDIKKANKTYEFSNLSVSEIVASKAVGKDILIRNYADNTAAKAAGFVSYSRSIENCLYTISQIN
jgi:hypothetical protein